MPLTVSPANSPSISTSPYAIITGGSSGIGFEVAKLLVGRGVSVWLLARRESLLEDAQAALSAYKINSETQVRTSQCDVSDPDQVQSVFNEIISTLGAPAYLFNFAGMAKPGEFLEQVAADFADHIKVNYLGTVYPTLVAARAMAAVGSGHIINCSSVAGFVGLYGYTAYGPSKFAVKGFSDALRLEIKLAGVKVSIVFPPDTETPQLEEENKHKPEITKLVNGQAKALKPEFVATEIMKAVDHGQYLILPGAETKFMYFLSNLLGSKVYWLMDKMVTDAARKVRQK